MTIARCIRAASAVASAGIAFATIAFAQSAPQPMPMTIVIHEAGPAWRPGKPPQEQDLNPHFGYVGDVFKKGTLVAYGTQSDAVRGYYVLRTADPGAIKAFVDADPAVKSGVLKQAGTIGWGVLINAFAPNQKGESFFLMRYKPGAKWVKDQPLTKQDIGAHFAYITEQTKKGIVVAGGPSATADEGIYVIRAADKAAADAFVAADPGVTSGVFAPVALGWNVIAMQPVK